MQSAYFFFILIMFLLFHCNCLYQNKNINSSLNSSFRSFQGFSFVLMIALFFGLRNPKIGVDSIAYLKWYREGTPDVIGKDSEKGFELLMYILHILMYGDKPFLIIMSLIISLFNLLLYKKINNEKYINYFIIQLCFYYFYIFHLSMYRQAIAIGLVGISFFNYKYKNKIGFWFYGILAFLIHYTAIIFIFFPFLNYFSKIIVSKKQHLILMILSLLFFSTNIVKLIIAKIPDFAPPVKILKSYYLYMNLGAIHITHSHLVSFFIILIFHINFNKIRKLNTFYLYVIHSLYFVTISLFKDSVILYDRLYFYIQIYEPVLIFEFSNIFKEKKLGKYLIYSFVLIYSLFTIFIWGPRNLIQPYYF